MIGHVPHRPTTPDVGAHRVRRQLLTNSVPVPAEGAQCTWPEPPIVAVRFVWQVDGEEWRDTIATSWAIVDDELVAEVLVDDPRRKTPTTWLRRADLVPR